MENSVPIELGDIMNKIRSIDDSFVKGNIATHFLEFVKSTDGNDLQINGNQEGLIHFARQILEVVERDMQGAHCHFDGSGLIDRCDMTITVCLKDANWD